MCERNVRIDPKSERLAFSPVTIIETPIPAALVSDEQIHAFSVAQFVASLRRFGVPTRSIREHDGISFPSRD